MGDALGSGSIICDWHLVWPWNLHQCGKSVETNSYKIFEANSYVCKSYREKTGKGVCLLPPSWMGLNIFKDLMVQLVWPL